MLGAIYAVNSKDKRNNLTDIQTHRQTYKRIDSVHNKQLNHNIVNSLTCMITEKMVV